MRCLPALLLGALLVSACSADGDGASVDEGTPSGGESVAVADLSSVEDPLLREILEPLARTHAGILSAPAEHRLQILLSVPRRGDGGTWTLERHGWRVDAEYFYPASTVKTAAAVAALEEIERLQAQGHPVDASTPLRIHPQFEETEPQEKDPGDVENGVITVAQEVRRIFLVSDNEAFNRLFELVGRDAVNESMRRLGLDSVHIVHRLSETRTADENRRFPRIEFLGPDGATVVEIPEREEELASSNVPAGGDEADRFIGVAHYAGGELVEEPFDFRPKNRFSLADLQALNVHLLFPELVGQPGVPAAGRLRLGDEHLEFVRGAMARLPRESANPVYDPAEVPDEWVKFILPGLRRVLDPADVAVHDKTGRAYGFSIENAWVVDRASVPPGGGPPARSFFLDAVLYTNDNGTLNDDGYEYEEADAFLADLGESVARVLWSESR